METDKKKRTALTCVLLLRGNEALEVPFSSSPLYSVDSLLDSVAKASQTLAYNLDASHLRRYCFHGKLHLVYIRDV